MTELSADGLTTDTTREGRVVIEPEYLEFLRSQGYLIEDISELHAVPSTSQEMIHLVAKIETYRYPRGSPKLDVVGDKVELWTCDCGDFQHRRSADVSDPNIDPTQSGECQHIMMVSD